MHINIFFRPGKFLLPSPSPNLKLIPCLLPWPERKVHCAQLCAKHALSSEIIKFFRKNFLASLVRNASRARVRGNLRTPKHRLRPKNYTENILK